MTNFVVDTFTETSDTVLTSHTGETGASWTLHPSYSVDNQSVIGADDNLGYNAVGSGSTAYYASGTPDTAEYDVTGDFVYTGGISGSSSKRLCGRIDTANNTMYYGGVTASSPYWILGKIVSGSFTTLDSDTTAFTANVTVKLEIRDASKKLYLDGVEVCTTADNEITAAGKAGIRFYANSDDFRLDNFIAVNAGGGGISIPVATNHIIKQLNG